MDLTFRRRTMKRCWGESGQNVALSEATMAFHQMRKPSNSKFADARKKGIQHPRMQTQQSLRICLVEAADKQGATVKTPANVLLKSQRN